MNAVGNDIVDLQIAYLSKKSQDQRFLNRVFTQDEQNCILQAARPETMLWLFWAAKEAAYKFISHLKGTPVFSHKAFQITFNNKQLQAQYDAYGIDLTYDIISYIPLTGDPFRKIFK